MGRKFVRSKNNWIKKKIWVKKKKLEIFMGQKKLGSTFFLHESSSWVKIGLHAENQLPGWSGSGLKVTAKLNNNNTEFLWWVVVGGSIPIIESNQLYWLRLSWVLTIKINKPERDVPHPVCHNFLRLVFFFALWYLR